MVLHIRKYDLGKNYTHSDSMRHGEVNRIWLCYMVVSAKECVEHMTPPYPSYSTGHGQRLDAHKFGDKKAAGSMINYGINQYVEHLEIQMSQMVFKGNTHNCICHHIYMD